MDEEIIRIFTETTEEIGLLYKSYEDLPDKVDKFITMLGKKVDKFKAKPAKAEIDLHDEIHEFKVLVDRKYTPTEIIPSKIGEQKRTIKKLQQKMDTVLNKLAKIKNKIAFGGNFIRTILMRPTMPYPKEGTPEVHEHINANIRNLNRAFDWAEKVTIDLFNMIDQDLNIIAIVDKLYIHQHVYESAEHIPYTMETLPDTLYFGSERRLSQLEGGKVFLTPYQGIASIFIIDKHKVMQDYIQKGIGHPAKRCGFNNGYEEWNWPDDRLEEPLSEIHINHNIASLTHKTSGTSTGYIYAVDISNHRDNLKPFVTEDPNREVVCYTGAGDLPPIVGVTPHTVNWTVEFSQENVDRHGVGIVEGVRGLMGDDLDWITQFLMEEGETAEPPKEEMSMAKKTDAAESDKNGVRRKKLYIAFIEWAKKFNNKNTFGSIFDKDAFNVTYPFVPEELRYFYRLANPILCVLSGDLTFFAVSELRKLNAKNPHLSELVIFAATPTDLRVFNVKDKKVYRATQEPTAVKLQEPLGNTFDTYIQKMVGQGDILNGPIE